MRRVLCLVLVGLLVLAVGGIALAESQGLDLEAMTFEELKELQAQVNLAMWATEEWQEVIVPKGIYEIGVDIPAGYWTISATKNYDMLTWGTELNENGTGVERGKVIEFESIHISSDPPGKVHWQLTEGTFLAVDGVVSFTPYVGKNLGFK